MARYKKLRAKRINKLIDAGFTRKEAEGLTGLKKDKKLVLLLKQKETRALINIRRKSGTDKIEYLDRYRDYADVFDTPEAWALYRYIEGVLIDEGLYVRPDKSHNLPGKSHSKPGVTHKRRLADGTIDYQYASAYERERRRKERARKRGEY